MAPMKKTRTHHWVSILLYSMGCIGFLGVLYFVAEPFFPDTSPELIPRDDALSARFMSDSRWGSRNRDAQNEALSDPVKEKIMLVLDRDKKFGKSKLIYRGLDGNDQFRMDVVILELDPNSFYPYFIAINEAKKGFRLVGQDFKLISARKSTIQLWHLKNSRRSY